MRRLEADKSVMSMLAQKLDQQKEHRLERAKRLVTALENGNEDEADRIVDEIGAVRETMLFQEVGKLTRQLHDAMMAFSLDTKITELAEKQIPDAKERLNYVITMTEQAANTTLNAVEELIPISEQLGGQSNELSTKLERLLRRELSDTELTQLNHELREYFCQSKISIETIQAKLTEVLMAQEFQDITGQVIRRVIDLVRDVEQSMVELIRVSGQQDPRRSLEQENQENQLQGPVVPGINSKDTMGNQDDVDDLLSSLGF